jgi:hypothetical protein
MSHTRSLHKNTKKEKERKATTFKVKGGQTKDLEQTYSLESLNQGYEVGGFSYSNILLGILGLGTIWYMINNNQQQNKE